MTVHSKSTHPAQPPYKLMAVLLLGAGLLLLGIAALAYLSLSKDAALNSDSSDYSAIPVKVNFPAPDISLFDLNGNKVSLSDLRGKYVLVNSWATWCPPCKQEMPDLEAYYQAHKDQNFTLVAIEDGEPKSEVAQFVASYKLTFSVWLDPEYQASTSFHSPGLPTSYIIDPDGIVRLTWTGAISDKMLEKYVTPLIQ